MSNDLRAKIESLQTEFEELKRFLNIDDKRRRLVALETQMKEANFWQEPKDVVKAQQEFAELSRLNETIERFAKEIGYLAELLPLARDGSKEAEQIENKVESLSVEIATESNKFLLSGKYDKLSAALSIQAGAGGKDAEDWVCLLLRMYERYAGLKGWNTKILYQQLGEGGGPEGRIGIKEVVLEINGDAAYGFLKKETGVHRLVRISPFSAKKLRHTSFAMVEALPKIDEDNRDIDIKPEELKVETFRASGPGGQNVNRRETAVRITHLPTGLQATSQVERLQGLNRKIAMQLLTARLVSRKEKEREGELKKVKGVKTSPSFGNQIRSYVLHPYKLVKDHRTGLEASNVEAVLNGSLDMFIGAEMKL